jgi:hypothetical protein
MSLSEDDFEIKSKIYSFKKLVCPVLIQDNIVPFYIFSNCRLAVVLGRSQYLRYDQYILKKSKKYFFTQTSAGGSHNIVLSSTHPFPSCMYNTPLSEGIFE